MTTRLIATILVVGAYVLSPLGAFAQRGQVKDIYTIDSKILGKQVKYSVYLPASYFTDDRSYPILYLLHGAGGNHASWVEDGELCRVASETIASGQSPEMIIVSPQGFMHAYVNAFDGSDKYEDFFIEELIPAVEKEFRVMSRRNKRAIAGLSMGGYGTLYHALVHKDLFGACYAMSAATSNFTFKVEEGKKVTKEQQAYIDGHDIVKIIGNLDLTKNAYGMVNVPRIFIDCGDDDFLLLSNFEVVKALREREIPHQFRVRDGGHTWIYWRTALPMAMEFVGEMFRQ